MCLYNVKVCVRELFGKNKQEIDCWKVVRKGATNRTKNNIYPPFYDINKKYPLGEIYRSNRENKKINSIDDNKWGDSVGKGVHVFTSYNSAKNYIAYVDSELIIKVKCKRSDYVAHNPINNQAVFMAVEFPKEITSE